MEAVKANPQVKVTCKQITPKLIIESIDKNTFNNLKKSIAKYCLSIEQIDHYKGEIDKDGYVVDVNDYSIWQRNHPNKISKQSVNNIIKSINNNSLVNWKFEDEGGAGYRYAKTYGSDEFEIKLLDINLIPHLQMAMIGLINVYYGYGNLDVDFSGGQFTIQ